MSSGGIFQLITNDGKQDRMLMATALLNKRLKDIETARARSESIADPTPTLVDIERTHILFMNAHFKPFAAIGYEYNVTQAQGDTRFGFQSQFSIPQFGDFFNDMALHINVGSVTAAATTSSNQYLQYVNYLGQRLVKRVEFQVNGNPLDAYDSDVQNFHRKFFVTPNKQVGWDRNVAQQLPMNGWKGAPNRAELQQVVAFTNGPQTPHAVQPAIEMWVPLLFWFNQDPRLSIPSVSIPFGQRFIYVAYANVNEVLQYVGYTEAADAPSTNAPPVPTLSGELYINNIFVNPEIHDIFIKRIGFSLIRVHRIQLTSFNQAVGRDLMYQLKWPVETIYMGYRPKVNTDVTSTTMLRAWNVFAQQTVATATTADMQKWWYFSTNPPVDTSLANLNAATTSAVGPATSAFWSTAGGYLVAGAGLNSYAAFNAYLASIGAPLLALPAGTVTSTIPTNVQLAAVSPTTFASVVAGSLVTAKYLTCTPTISTLELRAHGVPLYNTTPASFFNSYVPYTYGGHNIVTPDDCGAYMITFNLYPGTYQPSGHLNVSRAREFYINYTSSYIDSSHEVDAVYVAIALNFLLISDGSAILRYST